MVSGIAGVVVEVPTVDGRTEVPFIFEDETRFEFYSSSQIAETTFIELDGAAAWYRYVRDTAVCFEV
ncbi:MAG TPA: hypothetical protein VMS12_05275 [Thermoanaerobaculia bacterium]|nr:hypothetical protein [Thermoanaerobaculia bacterium]